MQIEQSFSNTKSYQFGIGLSLAHSTFVERYDNLFLIAPLVLFVFWCIGKKPANMITTDYCRQTPQLKGLYFHILILPSKLLMMIGIQYVISVYKKTMNGLYKMAITP